MLQLANSSNICSVSYLHEMSEVIEVTFFINGKSVAMVQDVVMLHLAVKCYTQRVIPWVIVALSYQE